MNRRERRSRKSRDRETLWFDVPFTKAPSATSTGAIVLSGYASTWGLDRDEEAVAPDAFSKSLGPYLQKNPMVLWQHNMDWPIGSITGGQTDENGLFVTASIPDPGPNAADWQKGAYAAIKTGVVRTFSIGGYMRREAKNTPAGPVFVIAEVDLFEVSVVSIPANADSIFEAAVKALAGERPGMSAKALAQMEQLLGFKALGDPELVTMAPPEREERYEMLSDLFFDQHGVDPPAYDSFRVVHAAKAAGVSTLKVATAATALSRAFYAPDSVDEKAGRAISSANQSRLRKALEAHDEMADHLVDAAESMKEAAAAHANSKMAIKDVLGISDEEDDTDPNDADEQEDEKPSSPTKAAKMLASDVSRQLGELGDARFRTTSQQVPGMIGPSNYVFVDDYDLDEGFVVYGVWASDPSEDTYYRVPILRGADGSLALGEGETEVEVQTSYVPKSAVGSMLAAVEDGVVRKAVLLSLQKAALVKTAKCPDCGAPLRGSGKSCLNDDCDWKADSGKSAANGGGETGPGSGSDPPSPDTPDPSPGDVDQKVVDDDLFARSVVEAMNELSLGAKAAETSGFDSKSALPLANLSIADRDRPWDSGAAKKRVHDWAAGDPDSASDGGAYDPAKLAKAYLWRDNGAPDDQVTSYRFIVADVVDGTLTYVPKAIFASANVVMGGRGGTSDEIANAIKPAIEKLYGKLASKFGDDSITVPWKDS